MNDREDLAQHIYITLRDKLMVRGDRVSWGSLSLSDREPYFSCVDSMIREKVRRQNLINLMSLTKADK